MDRFIEENGAGVDDNLNQILNEQQEGVDKLFPHMSGKLIDLNNQ